MNKCSSSTKLLIMYHYLIFCILPCDLRIKNKLHILKIDYDKLIFQNYLNYLEITFKYLCAQKHICIIHNHSFTQMKFTRSLMFN
jgi:hypothetical protein